MKHEIEDIFKEKFSQHTSEPSSGLFDKIQAKRTKSKKMAWIWSSAAVILIITLVSWWNMKNDSTLTPSNIVDTTETSAPSANKLDISSTDIVVDDKNENSTFKNEVIESTAISTQERAVTSNNSIGSSKTNKQTSTEITNKESTENEIVNKELAALFEEILKNNNPSNSTAGTLFKRDSKEQVNQAPIIENRSNETTRDVNNNTSESKNNITTSSTYSISDKEISKASENTSNMDDSSTFDENVADLENTEINEDNKNLPIHKLVPYSKWGISSSVGPGFAGRVLSGSPNYIKSRNNTETQQISYDFDVRAVYEINEKWNMQLGVNTSKRNESFEYRSPDFTVETVREKQRQEVVIHPVYGRIVREYTVTVTESNEIAGELFKNQNSYLNISIPIAIERYLYRSEKWSVISKGEILAGVYSKASGTQISANSDLNSLSSSDYREAGINQAGIGIGALYKINNRLTFLTYPQARMTLNSSFSNQYLLKQREIGVFGHLGFRVRL